MDTHATGGGREFKEVRGDEEGNAVEGLQEGNSNLLMFNNRKGSLVDMGLDDGDGGFSVITYLIPTRGMLGLRSGLLTATRGTVIIDSLFDSFQPLAGDLGGKEKVRKGAKSKGKVWAHRL